MVHIGTEGLKDPGGIGILKGKSKLDTQKSKTHVPDLPKRKARLFSHDVIILMPANIVELDEKEGESGRKSEGEKGR